MNSVVYDRMGGLARVSRWERNIGVDVEERRLERGETRSRVSRCESGVRELELLGRILYIAVARPLFKLFYLSELGRSFRVRYGSEFSYDSDDYLYWLAT